MASAFDTESRTLGGSVRDHLGEHLRAYYQELIEDNLPIELSKLVQRLKRAIEARSGAPDPAFVAELMKAVPQLRAFALSRTRNAHQAEDLVQETILRAWDKRSSFEPGTNLTAWLFTILRNQHHSVHRKLKREVEDADGGYAEQQIVLPDQFHRLELQDMTTALAKLPTDQREAILLIGAQGVSYEDAAQMMGVAPGTIKSRVNRARTRLAALLGVDSEDSGGHRLLRD